MALKYPDDMGIQHLHARRICLCIKIEQGSITQKMAIDIFDQAHEYVIKKKKEEQGEAWNQAGWLTRIIGKGRRHYEFRNYFRKT